MRLFGKCLFFKVCVFTSLFDTEYFVVLLPFFLKVGGVIGFHVFVWGWKRLAFFLKCELLSGNIVVCAIRG